jgi:hypothetical protein
MHQFTAKLSGSYPQQQVHQMLGVQQEHGQNAEARASDDWPRQAGITPFRGPAEPVVERDSHTQEGQLNVYNDRQSPPARNAWMDQTIPAQNVPYCRNTFPPPSVNGDPIGQVEYPSVENRSLGVTYGSFGSAHGENHRQKAPRVSQASIHYMLHGCLRY